MQMDTINIFPSPLLSVTKAYFNSSSSNTDTQNGTGALLANHIYFWRVRAINLVDTTAWTVWAFNTGATPVLIPSDPILVSPINSAIGQPTSLTLDWSASTNATSYEYQYDTSPSFSTSINGSTALSQANISGLNINNITYYWRVRALRGTTLYSNWSTVWHFTTGCSLSTPVSSPANIYGSGSTLLVATGAIGYHWYDAATTGNLLGSSATYNTPVLTQTDTFYVCAYDGVCESGRIPVIVTVSPYPVPTITANGPINFCGGNSVLLTAGGGSSYHWNTGATSTSITVTQSGSYYATVSALGCSDNTDTIHVIVLPLPATPASIMGNYFVCSNSYGESYSISSVPNATSYQWTVPSGATIVSGQGSTSIVVNWGTVSGDICVSASNDSCNGIAACTPITVVLPPGNPVSVVGNISVCENATQVYSISSVTGATSYYWTIPSGANIVSGQGTTSVTVTWGSTGDNVCVVAINSCDTSANVCSMVTVNPNPSIPTITQVGNTLQSSVATGYQWYDGSTAISGANSQTYIPTASGT
jgi:hypothetical protein